ncbi:MAG: EscU/YscU/HrcU family type III secretion system export apparatus switch protein [Candidatus Gastranaerophilales bacterium]|nr:EscU/YscU/HrcU family type III secretion system export apparatus switch protein [Candidatus Gastranaerophilales bacterium]
MGDENKQYEASQQKLQKARKEGQVVKSKDFSMALALLVMFIAIIKLAPFIWDQISILFIYLYDKIPDKHIEDIGYVHLATAVLIPTFLIIGPILVLAAFIAILGDFIQVGPLVTTKPLEPNLDKLNPTKYFKNLMSPKTAFELVKNIVKVALLGFIGWMVYNSHLEAIIGLINIENSFAILNEFGSLIIDFVMKAGIAFLIIAAADYGMVRWKFLQDQKMSFKEVKDEYKNSEGDPNVKAALRQRRQQMMQKKMMDSVPDADFVVTNPTHIACALKYDPQNMESPKLLAKGSELFAKKIIEIAREHTVPVIENPPVARAIYRMVEVNALIPPELYKAVAEILIFVYNLRNTQKGSNIK